MSTARPRRHALVVRLDSLGDMVIGGPAVRAVAAAAERVTVLAGPRGAEAARLLPGVDDVLVWNCPWIAAPPAPPVDDAEIATLVRNLHALEVDEALILTSFHQNALPTALLLKLAGVARIAAVSEDYPGSLLTTRIAPPPDAPEPVRMLAIARAAGYELPPGDDGRLALRAADRAACVPNERFVVVHPGAGAPARALPAHQWAAIVTALVSSGHPVVITGSSHERRDAEQIAVASGRSSQVTSLAGQLDLSQLAAVLREASVCVAANTGPAHVAAAMGTPVVSLFAPVVPAVRWAPYGVPVALLGDQTAPCAGTRAVRCPVVGHPCLSSVTPEEVVAAVESLGGRPVTAPAEAVSA